MSAHAGGLPNTQTGRRQAGAHRKADRMARHVFRPQRVWPAVIAALLLVAGGVLTAIEVFSEMAGRPAKIVPYDQVTDWADGVAWEDSAPLAIASGVAVAGLLFLLGALVPGRSRVVPLHGTDPDLVMGITRGGLKQAVGLAAEGAPGVSAVRRVRVRRHRIKVVAVTAVRDSWGLDDQVVEVVRARLDEIEPLPAMSVSVRVKQREH